MSVEGLLCAFYSVHPGDGVVTRADSGLYMLSSYIMVGDTIHTAVCEWHSMLSSVRSVILGSHDRQSDTLSSFLRLLIYEGRQWVDNHPNNQV